MVPPWLYVLPHRVDASHDTLPRVKPAAYIQPYRVTYISKKRELNSY
jgi:hypothetical protein